MMKSNNYAVIMAGGVGSRFWPYSRKSRPKQFLDILNTGKSLIQMAYDRFRRYVPAENIYVVTHQDYQGLVSEQLPELSEDRILTEPMRRSTAPCIAYACYKISKKNADALITVTPSDHLIANEPAFYKAWDYALQAASDQEKLVTIGITPHRPETGFGYIRFLPQSEPVKKVKAFVEKPTKEKAVEFLQEGGYLWNSGIFIWGVRAIINAVKTSLPQVASLFEDALPALDTREEKAAVELAYSQCPAISIDYGVMEQAEHVYVVPGDFTWSDLGSWNALHEHAQPDNDDNVVYGDALLYETKNTLVKVADNKLVVVQGLENYLVAECDDVIIICKRDDEQRFRDVVKDVKDRKGEHYL